jgi:hypothetical protein
MTTTPRTPQPLTDEQLAEIQARASSRSIALTAWLDKFSPLVEGQAEVENAETVLSEDVPALLAEVDRFKDENALLAEAGDRAILKAAPVGDEDWDDETWAAWWRHCERAHADAPNATCGPRGRCVMTTPALPLPAGVDPHSLTDDFAVQILSDEGAQCGDCDDRPGDRACPDCEKTRIDYVQALRAAGWGPTTALIAEIQRNYGALVKVDEFVAKRAEYVTAINDSHNEADYWRSQGHAAARRQLAQRLGLPVAWPAKYEEAAS